MSETTQTPAPRILSFEEIVAAPDITRETVDLPEWGGVVEIQGLTMAQIDEVSKAATTTQSIAGGKSKKVIDNDKWAYGMLAAACINPTMTLEQARQLDKKAAKPTQRLLKAVLAASGLTEESAKEAEKSDSAES